MSKKLNELIDPPVISDEEYDHWMATAKKGDPIPEFIHQYFREVIMPQAEARQERWYRLVKDIK